MENVRRDNCMLIRDLLDTCLRYILVEHKQDGLKRAIEHIKGCVSDLYQNKIDISKLVITKSLTKKSADDDDAEEEADDKKGGGGSNKLSQATKAKKESDKPAANTYKGKQAHVELAKKMAKRDPGSAPHVSKQTALTTKGEAN